MKIIEIFFNARLRELQLFGNFLFFYGRKKIKVGLVFFEKQKDTLVKFLLMKRGRYNRPFLHIMTMGLLAIGILVAPVLADTYPLISHSSLAVSRLPSVNTEAQSVTADQEVFSTDVSQKPRDSVVTYTVQRGDTLSTIADKFGISIDTIKWDNNISDDSITVGDTLKIIPVSGVYYKVQFGDTIYSIAKKLSTNPQKIVDFPFNDFANPETFSLVVGQMLVVPDGVPPTEHAIPVAPVYVAQSLSGEKPSSGGFIWPIHGEITQYFTWYHSGVDIAGPIGTPIYAAKAGTVLEASCGWNYGYGCHVLLDNGGAFSTMYAHMVTAPSVSVGQSVSQGQVIGYRGSTGRSTGPHTHFEIRIGGRAVNPIAYLP